MANTNAYVSVSHLQNYHGKIKGYIDAADAKSLKGYLKVDNTWNFYTVEVPTAEDTPVFSIDVPTEYFLDQAKTTFVQNFVWSEELYAGSTNPELDGKPVFVMAVKGDDNTVTYSFIDVTTLVDIYTGVETATAAVTVSADNKISADVKISAAEGNFIEAKEDGLYVTVEPTDISGKADKLTENIKNAQILVDDGEGNIAAGGVTIEEVTTSIKEDILSNFDFETDVNAEIDSWF